MTTTRRATAALAGLGLATCLLVTACSGDEADERGVDARSYYDDYEAGGDEAGAMPMQSAAEAGAPADRGGQPDEPDEPDEPDPDEDDTFVEAGVDGFTATGVDPRSTFGLDVDDGSFGVARSLLTDGYPVPSASVRPEEWVNALPYDDPAPRGADLGLTAESGVSPTLDDGTQVVRVAVGAREIAPDDRPRVNVTLVVDRSGSMDVRNRLGLVQSSLAVLAERLDDDDTVSVVSFEDRAVPILEPTPVRETDEILDAIERLRPGGSTNLEAGLDLGYEQARDGFDHDAVNVVVLCSDGVANVGATGPGSILDTIAEEGADGIHLVTVGFGMGTYNDHLMEQLADRGDGFYAYVDTFAEAEQLFGTDLTTTLVPVAAEARAQVSFDPELVSSYRLVGYENRAIDDDDYDDLSIDAGELGAGHRATALYEVVLADGVAPGTTVGDASVRWRSTATDEPAEATIDLVAADPTAAPSDAWSLATAAADLAQVVKGAGPVPERGVSIDDVADRLATLVARDVPGAGELAELAELAASVR